MPTPEKLKTMLAISGFVSGHPYNKMFKNTDGIVKFLLEFLDPTKEVLVKKINLINYGIMKEKDTNYWVFLNIMQQHHFIKLNKVQKKSADGQEYYYVLISPGEKLNPSYLIHDVPF